MVREEIEVIWVVCIIIIMLLLLVGALFMGVILYYQNIRAREFDNLP